ncbi:hypothetical protein K432DRAFT_419507 [Lepidopterella palustris CBS 459.81]|uniref:MYND-type domain-containing protein n=1 Tax=Lepidopterella palustris CBS 459.81 TaxID=1314670 RepID=A0A8E2E222_9PEZI|nr:hypothetical protein K432DRAFT_419507 [Lepidopterella palustris CBS 459.81]
METTDPANQFVCAEWSEGSNSCHKVGKFACKDCLLVLYCSRECQKSHWSQHKNDCRSPLIEESWRPGWEIEGRTPTFVDGSPVQPFGSIKFLWGNVPAFDVLRLQSNEGEAHEGPINLLFAASGDLRNVVRTIAALPQDYNKPIRIPINDRDFDIVARNTIMLLVALTVQNSVQAVECMLHLWYSALIPRSCVEIIQGEIRSLIKAVCTKIAGKANSTLLGKTWTFGTRSLRVVLPKEKWLSLLSYFEVPEGLSMQRAQEIRASVVQAPERRDFRERRRIAQSPFHRVCAERFCLDGLLLPFGHPRPQFDTPNPTFFQTSDVWPMKDGADPFDGWSLAQVLETPSGPAKNDLYGKLFYYLRDLFTLFHRRLSSLDISFQLFQVDVRQLPRHVAGQRFARIEVANISDAGYIGIAQTIALLGPLLQPPEENPHATLITLFLNAVDETITKRDEVQGLPEEMQRLSRYLPLKSPSSSYNAEVVGLLSARSLVRDVDRIFERYMRNHRFQEVGQLTGMMMKEQNTIIEKWPMRPKLQPGDAGAQQEFDTLHSSAHSGHERYVEWKKTNTRLNIKGSGPRQLLLN